MTKITQRKTKITLHPTKGVNPHMGCCPQCGEDNGELFLVGAKDSIYKCSLNHHLIGGPDMCPLCQQEGKQNRASQFVRKLEDNERIPSSLCKKCEQEQKENAEIVEAGGVYFRCIDCGIEGVIKPSDFTKAARKSAGVAPPDPLGVEFTKNDCPKCNKR